MPNTLSRDAEVVTDRIQRFFSSATNAKSPTDYERGSSVESLIKDSIDVTQASGSHDDVNGVGASVHVYSGGQQVAEREVPLLNEHGVKANGWLRPIEDGLHFARVHLQGCG